MVQYIKKLRSFLKVIFFILLLNFTLLSESKFVALTFDDGPHPEFTPKLINILKKYNAKATFFVVGMMVKKYPYLVRMLVNSGMDIGNHTFNHRRLKFIPYNDRIKEIEETNKIIEKNAKIKVRYFRPPGGRYDWETINLAEKLGMEVILWDINSNDSNKFLTKKEFFSGVMKNLRNFSIILLHDGARLTLKVLPELLRELKKRGYKFLTISELKKESQKCLIYQDFKKELF